MQEREKEKSDRLPTARLRIVLPIGGREKQPGGNIYQRFERSGANPGAIYYCYHIF